jgi:SAM-dependent methyltransferase
MHHQRMTTEPPNQSGAPKPTTPATGSGTPPGGFAKRAQDYASVRDWPGYFALMEGKPARETLVEALASFEREDARRAGAPSAEPRPERLAVDLGCGEGRDTLELLARGWRVVAVDAHPEAFERLVRRVPPDQRERLTTIEGTFAASRWPEADLVNASFALPFCEPRDWEDVWARVVGSVRPGGRFAGQLFGDRDGWAALPDRSHHARERLDGMFKGFVLESLREEDRPDTTHDGRDKHWHVFHIVARRRA